MLEKIFRKHYSNIVVNNSIEKINLNKKKNQIWLTGSRYILVTNNTKRKKKLHSKF